MIISEQLIGELDVYTDEVSDIGPAYVPQISKMSEHEERRAVELWSVMVWYIVREKDVPDHINYEYNRIVRGWSEERKQSFFEGL